VKVRLRLADEFRLESGLTASNQSASVRESDVSQPTIAMIKRIEIQNYRSCYSTSIEFEGNVCALIGKNGVGKTNILRSIRWLASAIVVPAPLWTHFAPGLSNPHVRTAVRVQLSLDPKNFDYVIEMPPLHGVQGELVSGVTESLTLRGNHGESTAVFQRSCEEIKISGRNDPIRVNRWTPSTGALLSLLPSSDPVMKDLGEMAKFLKTVQYYAMDDDSSSNDDMISESMYDDWLVSFQSDGTLTGSSALRLIYMWENDKDLFDEFQTLIGPDGLGILTQIQIHTERPTSPAGRSGGFTNGPATKVYLPRFQPAAQMGGYNTNSWFAFSDLSAGTRRMIQIVVSLLFDKRSVMLIEQPEDSIHPGLLRKLIDLFRSYSDRSQIIFATHSSEVLDMLRPEEVVLVTAPEGRTEARKLSSDEVSQAERFLKSEGSLSEFLEPFDES
jgi:hypothetical protein